MTNTEKEIKANELAGILEMIKPILLTVDLEFAKQSVEDMRQRAIYLDSAAVLNPMYTPLKSDIILKQAEALLCFTRFIELNFEIGTMKKQLEQEQSNKDDLIKLFS